MPDHVLDAPPRSGEAQPFSLPALPEPPACVLRSTAEAAADAAPAPYAPAGTEAPSGPDGARDMPEEDLDANLEHPAAAMVERGQREAASVGPAASGGPELRGAASAPATAALSSLSAAQAARAAPGACTDDAGVQHKRPFGGGSYGTKAGPGMASAACCAASADPCGQHMGGAYAGVGVAAGGCFEEPAAQDSAGSGDRGAEPQRAPVNARRGLDHSELEGMPRDDGVALPGKRPRVAVY